MYVALRVCLKTLLPVSLTLCQPDVTSNKAHISICAGFEV